MGDLARVGGTAPDRVRALLPSLGAREVGERILGGPAFASLRDAILAVLDGHHRDQPMEHGLPAERIAEIVGGIAAGCEMAGCALVGGETAEHPGLMNADHYDIAGTGVGIVEADRALGPERVREGDVVIAMASSGLHSNGYSLVRHVLL